MVLSKFDNLPTELIVEIGDYLDGCDLYYAFYGLNQRMNKILDQQCNRLHVNFANMSKIKFDFYCGHILSHISSNVVSLTLCGDNSSTPGQLAIFLSHFKSLVNAFVRIESFKLTDYTKVDVEMLVPHLTMLIHLKHLSIGKHERLMPFATDSIELFDVDAGLPTSLHSFAFPYEISNRWIQSLNVTTSFITKQLHVHLIRINAFLAFIQRFPYLENLTAVIKNMNEVDWPIENTFQHDILLHGLRYLNINITQEVVFDDFATVLRSLTQLHSLSIEALDPRLEFLDASRWETALPSKLSLFRFDMTITSSENVDCHELLKSFQSQFWISRGWFVQCRLRDQGRFFRLSTIESSIISILYWPDDEVFLLESTLTVVYPNVTHIELWWNLSKSTQAICPNVRSIQFYGASNDRDEPIHLNILELLQNPSFEHIIINDNLPIDHTRFASILGKSSDNIKILTCSGNWLTTMLEHQQYEWICLLVTISIRKLIVTDEFFVFSKANLIAFCRTFINLRELTVKIESKEDLFFLLNTLENLTMANMTLPLRHFDDVTDELKMIGENTILNDFTIRKQHISIDTCRLLLWIGSRHTNNRLQIRRNLFLKYSNTF